MSLFKKKPPPKLMVPCWHCGVAFQIAEGTSSQLVSCKPEQHELPFVGRMVWLCRGCTQLNKELEKDWAVNG